MNNKHAELILQYAQDWINTDIPWDLWEAVDENGCWKTLCRHPSWDDEIDYRRKPKTIKIGDFDVPEPERVAPPSE
jgi:hypothetical protein